MGRIIAFPDKNLRLPDLPAQDGNRYSSALHGSRDNVVLFSGVFVEYHDEALPPLKTDALHADIKSATAEQSITTGLRLRDSARQEEDCKSEKTPRLNHR